jgi:two-component system chemotaxis response regulator CheB
MIRVLVVDDSAIVRNVLCRELAKHPSIEVVGSAVDPYVAREKIMQLRPDVITLDVEMPRMDGLTFLEKLMSARPMPVVVLSSLTPKNSPNTFRALELGAVEVIPKPDSSISVPEVAEHLVRAVLAAAGARVKKYEPRGNQVSATANATLETTNKVVAIGASTGGTQALERLMRDLPVTFPGTLIVQHMPTGFTASFAKRLDSVSPMSVKEATDGQPVSRGVALVAPAGKHLHLVRSGASYVVRVKDGPAVHHVKPAVDILFESVAKSAGSNALGCILTGMGQDGAKGLLAMRQAGAFTVAESEETCVVYGMPKAAVEAGAVAEIVRLERVAETLIHAVASRAARGSFKTTPTASFTR